MFLYFSFPSVLQVTEGGGDLPTAHGEPQRQNQIPHTGSFYRMEVGGAQPARLNLCSLTQHILNKQSLRMDHCKKEDKQKEFMEHGGS